MIPTFPAELTDRIIDFLHSDKDALSSCSLVCKSWLPSSRYHCSLCISSRNVDSFVKLLDSPISTIAKYAHCLELQPSTHIIDRITPYLGSITARSLVLWNEGWGPHRKLGDDVLKWCVRLTDIDIDNPSFSTAEEFFGFFASLHSMATLAVTSEQVNSFIFPSNFRSIRIWLLGFIPRLSWFVSVAQILFVTRLTICNIQNENRDTVRDLLLSLGSSVQTLHLEFTKNSLGAFVLSLYRSFPFDGTFQKKSVIVLT
jgi:hypothetical protein